MTTKFCYHLKTETVWNRKHSHIKNRRRRKTFNDLNRSQDCFSEFHMPDERDLSLAAMTQMCELFPSSFSLTNFFTIVTATTTRVSMNDVLLERREIRKKSCGCAMKNESFFYLTNSSLHVSHFKRGCFAEFKTLLLLIQTKTVEERNSYRKRHASPSWFMVNHFDDFEMSFLRVWCFGCVRLFNCSSLYDFELKFLILAAKELGSFINQALNACWKVRSVCIQSDCYRKALNICYTFFFLLVFLCWSIGE